VQGRVTVQNAESTISCCFAPTARRSICWRWWARSRTWASPTVIRGDDHLNNAFRQLAIIRRWAVRKPTYATSRDTRQDGAKLSKAPRRACVETFATNMGVLPGRLFNYLLRLGWVAWRRRKLSPRSAIGGMVHIANAGRSPSRFDWNKLDRPQRPLQSERPTTAARDVIDHKTRGLLGRGPRRRRIDLLAKACRC